MLEDLLAEIQRRKLYVTNLYEGKDKLWRCLLRNKPNGGNGLVTHRGSGKTMAEAIQDALPHPQPIPQFENLLG